MRIETVFFIYRRLAKRSIDLCEEIEILRDYHADLEKEPTAVVVKFKAKEKRKLKKDEVCLISKICSYHRIICDMNDKGELEFR